MHCWTLRQRRGAKYHIKELEMMMPLKKKRINELLPVCALCAAKTILNTQRIVDYSYIYI
jgi:hypothetical protein